MNAEERAHVEHLLEINRAHLRELETQQAKLGILAPSSIAVQIAGYQRTIADLEGQLSKAMPRHNLPPRDYEQFVGRQKELAEVRRLLGPKSRAYVITIDGIGGIGKSALALETAYTFVDQYAALPEAERFDAIVWASAKRSYLTADGILERRQVFRTLEDLFAAIAQVLDAPTITSARVEEQRTIVEEVLREQRTLLILDNLETVDDEDMLVFLRELPDPTKAIVTTRQRIDVAHPIRLSGMPHEDALALVEQETARKGVALASDAQAELWQRTGGVPLAIVWSIGLMGLGGSIESVLRRLGSGQSDIARFCFGESVGQIQGRDAYRLLLALALFDASVNRDMLGVVAGLGEDEFGRDTGLEDILRLSLANKESDRFSLLPITRTYVLGELARAPDIERALREQQIECLANLAKPYAGLRWRPSDRLLLLQEGAHLQTLAEWCRHTDRYDVLLRILPGLVRYYDLVGRISDALTIAQIGVNYARLVNDTEIIVAMQIFPISWVLRRRKHQHRQAEAALQDAISIAKQTGDVVRQCDALVAYARILRETRNYNQALEQCQQARDIIDQVDNEYRAYVQANIEYELGLNARDRHEWQEARSYFAHIREMFSQHDSDPIFVAEFSWKVVRQLGVVAQLEGDLVSAAQLYRQAVDLCVAAAGHIHVANILVRLAKVEVERSHPSLAQAAINEAMPYIRQFGLKQEQAEAAALLAQIAQSGDAEIQ
jgi:tetratricopeptide (TPR) repeat protein